MADGTDGFAVKLWRSRSGRAGIILCSLIVLAAFCAPLITLYNPLEMGVGTRLSGPSGQHPMGTDEYGRDIMTRILYGARISIVAGVGAVLIASFVGVNTGMVAGYFGGALDSVLMRIMDAIISFPATLMAIVVIAIIGTNSLSSILAIAIVNIPTFARLTRANVLSEISKGYVEANRALGFSHTRIMYQEILLNVLSTLFVQITVSIANAIMLESALSFLGLGNPPPAPSWGSMLSTGKDYMLYAPTYAIFPGLSLTVLIVGLYLLGDGLRDVFDSRQSGGR
mgnify:FL=1